MQWFYVKPSAFMRSGCLSSSSSSSCHLPPPHQIVSLKGLCLLVPWWVHFKVKGDAADQAPWPFMPGPLGPTQIMWKVLRLYRGTQRCKWHVGEINYSVIVYHLFGWWWIIDVRMKCCLCLNPSDNSQRRCLTRPKHKRCVGVLADELLERLLL